jgi:hypothetical protein
MQFVIPSTITTTRILGNAYLAPRRVAPAPSPKTLWRRACGFREYLTEPGSTGGTMDDSTREPCISCSVGRVKE